MMVQSATTTYLIVEKGWHVCGLHRWINQHATTLFRSCHQRKLLLFLAGLLHLLELKRWRVCVQGPHTILFATSFILSFNLVIPFGVVRTLSLARVVVIFVVLL